VVVLLLSPDGVIRERRVDPLAHEPLGGSVGDGDRRAVLLVVDHQLGVAEVLQGELARRAEDLDGDSDQGGIGGWRLDV
jgi:hypothetical protein